MRKILSLLLITILFTSCSFGKKDEIKDVNINIGENGVEISTGEDGVEISTGEDGVEISTGEDGVEISTGEDGVEISTGEDGVEINTGENGIDVSITDDDKLVEDAIKEIDKIISEIEEDVK